MSDPSWWFDRRRGGGGGNSSTLPADVYLAEDTKLGRKVALKVLPPELAENEERRARFVREAKAASAIDHPNVAHIHEIGEADGIHFIAMQFVDGKNLAARVKGDTLATADIIAIGLQVADALDAAHAKRIVHRDIKPANLVLTDRNQIKGPRFRRGEIDGHGRSVARFRSCHRSEDGGRGGDGDRALHEPRAGSWARRRWTLGHFFPRCRPLRAHHRPLAFFGWKPDRDHRAHRQRAARGDRSVQLRRARGARAADFEKAVAGNLNLPHARWKLANAYLRSRDGERSIALLAPLEEAFSSEFEVIAGLGFAYYFMDDFQKATEYLEKAMTIRPPDTELLNAIGDCHLRLGNPDKAKAYFERSLELEPSQEAVKRRLAELSSQGS